jgi:hypothetical protein
VSRGLLVEVRVIQERRGVVAVSAHPKVWRISHPGPRGKRAQELVIDRTVRASGVEPAPIHSRYLTPRCS